MDVRSQKASPSGDTVSRVLNHQPVDPIPKGELFINQSFLDHHFGEFKGETILQLQAAGESLGLSLIGIDLSPSWSQLLLEDRQYRKLEDYFLVGCLSGPVAGLIETHGFFNVFLSMKNDRTLFPALEATLLEKVEKKTQEAHHNGFRAMVVTDDIAGNKGLLFSNSDFQELVRPIYQKIARIIKGRGLYVFFHSDGDISAIIPDLIEAGFDCLHPVDTRAGLDLFDLNEKFGHQMSFMGHIDLMDWNEDRIAQEIRRAEKEFKNGGLILGSSGGLSLETAEAKLDLLYPPWNSKEAHP